ncbi:MAG TPA: hypothetical protein VFH95_10940 [Candidatus Kapabacteria bacterium]|nr:hypothetical protein [Candidatus Kapabacteria bacterium]
MTYTTDIVYETPEVRNRTHQRNRQLFFFLFFLCGTIIAAIGWFAEWKQLADRIPFFRYCDLIAVVGHALQVIGAFGSLLTPDYVEREEEEEAR